MYNQFMNMLKKKYSLSQMYIIIVKAVRSFPNLIRNRRSKEVDSKLIERLMLATTEVNGCDVCSYAHTKMALLEGFEQEEIDAFLSGSEAYVKKEEAKAILYAQHVADTMGNPDVESTDVLIQSYGESSSRIMRSSINVMMMGNVSGIPISALIRRIQGKPYQNSSIVYEISMILVQPIVFILAIIHAIIDRFTLNKFIV
jgi:AhpD family alkylhydroperoxidase